MSFLLKDTIHDSVVDAVYNELLTRRSHYYYYISRVVPWSNPASPDTPLTSKAYENETRNKIISAKRITSADVSYVIPRVDWTSGTIYDRYDDYTESYTAYSGATRLRDANFYVLTDDFHVYKCIFNNNNSASTSKPTGTDPTTTTTADGYVWKYMYTIPLSLRTKFLTVDYMPVQRSVLNPYYSNGEIDKVYIDAGGSGYLGNSAVSLTVFGTFGPGGGNAVANVFAVFNEYGSIEEVFIKDRGNNYTTANVYIDDGAGTGVSKYYGLSNVLITNPGAGYNSDVVANTTAVVRTSGSGQPNSNAVISLVYQNESVVGVNILNAGSGFVPAIAANSTVVITTTGNAQPSTNATITPNFARSAILKPILVDGQVDRVVVEDPGIDYSANIQTTLVITGDGANAYLIPYVGSNGQVEDVIIARRGEGYTYADIEVVGDGTGANVSVDLSSGDLDTTQATVELAAIDGGIHSFRVISGGTSYANANVRIVGDGTGFVGNVVLNNANAVSYITVSNPGSGYTYANVIIGGTAGANANVVAIFPPYGGHGYNPVKELFADTLMFYSTINNERLHGVDVNNDYRQFGIVKDFRQYGNQKAFANTVGTACFLITLDTVTDSLSNTLARDTILELTSDTTRKFEVVEVVSANTQALVTSLNNYSLLTNDVLNDPVTDSNYTVETIDYLPSINKFSGDLLFIDNRTSVSYSDDQLVTLRTVLRL